MNEKIHTFRQRHFSGYLQRRLDYIFISNQIQPYVNKTEIKIAISTDHSPVFINLSLDDVLFQKGSGFWKFNSSLNKDTTFTTGMHSLINNFLENAPFNDKQLQWELLKYEINKISINY